MRKELLSPEAFEDAVWEEIQISSEFDLPMCALVLFLPSGPDADLSRLVLDSLCLADLAAVTAPGELSLVLPNTSREEARAVEERLLRVAPTGSALRAAAYHPADTTGMLLERAHRGEAP